VTRPTEARGQFRHIAVRATGEDQQRAALAGDIFEQRVGIGGLEACKGGAVQDDEAEAAPVPERFRIDCEEPPRLGASLPTAW